MKLDDTLRACLKVSGESTYVLRTMHCSTHERPLTSASGRYIAASVWQRLPFPAFAHVYLGLCTLKRMRTRARDAPPPAFAELPCGGYPCEPVTRVDAEARNS